MIPLALPDCGTRFRFLAFKQQPVSIYGSAELSEVTANTVAQAVRNNSLQKRPASNGPDLFFLVPDFIDHWTGAAEIQDVDDCGDRYRLGAHGTAC